MKTYLMALFLLVCAVMLTVVAPGQGRYYDFNNKEYVVSVGTSTPVQVGGFQPGRKYYLVVNESADYVVRHATYPLTQTNIQGTHTNKGKKIDKNLGSWEDMYNIYQSSWFVLLSSAGAPADATAITAQVYYYERY